MLPGCYWLAAQQRKIYSHVRLDLDRLSVENVRPIAPLLNGVNGSLNEHGMATQDLQLFNMAIFTDHCLQFHQSLNPGRAR